MKNFFLYVMAVCYLLAGVFHFVRPRFYLKIMPPWVPYHMQMVYASGMCEIVCALLLLNSATQKAGAWALIILLIAIFPANIQMAINFARVNNPYLWVAILRLPLQLLFIWFAWIYTKA